MQAPHYLVFFTLQLFTFYILILKERSKSSLRIFLLSLCCNFSLILRQNAENAETA